MHPTFACDASGRAELAMTRLDLNETRMARVLRVDTVVDGKPTKLEALDSSVWVRRDGKWVCALHTETLAGDPFGRDRRA